MGGSWDSLGVMLVKTRNRDCGNRKERINVKAKVQNVGVSDRLCGVEQLVWTANGMTLPISRACSFDPGAEFFFYGNQHLWSECASHNPDLHSETESS